MEMEDKIQGIYLECEKNLSYYNDHFKSHIYIKKMKDEPLGRCEHVLGWCKELNKLFNAYWEVYMCVPEGTWKMYENLEIVGLQEQEFLKLAVDRLDNHIKEKPKLIIKGKITRVKKMSNARKEILRKISESDIVQPEESK